MSILDDILSERPKFHAGETEFAHSFDPGASVLPRKLSNALATGEQSCYGIEDEVAHFLFDSVAAGDNTLEIGAGLSTLVFALKCSQHVSVTPNREEVDRIKLYSELKAIDLSRVEFVIDYSDHYLPQAQDFNHLDLVFIDGKHAFPWPILDWFYTSDRLREGGIMVLDDIGMKPVKIVVDFMKADPAWQFVQSIGNRTAAFRRIGDLAIRQTAWHMQPYVTKLSWSERIRRRFFPSA